MNKLKACLEAHTEDNLGVPEPPEPSTKDKQFVVMQGPLSTTFALTLMKRFSTPEPEDQFVRHDDGKDKDPVKLPEASDAAVDAVNTQTTVDSNAKNGDRTAEQEPQSLAMEMQMAYVTNAIETVGARTTQAEAEMARDLQRYRSYIVMTTRSHFVHLESSAQR